jgi:hypothetical protein
MAVDPLIAAVSPPVDYYVVLRPFSGEAETRYVRGEVVDTTGWSHRAQLVELRYLAPLPYGAPVPDAGSDGRRMLELTAEQEAGVPETKRVVARSKAPRTV